MKTDLYTKLVLTIIALMLSVNVFQNLFSVQNAKADGLYDCDQCDLLDDIDRRTRAMESTLSDVESSSARAASKAFGNYCGSCP